MSSADPSSSPSAAPPAGTAGATTDGELEQDGLGRDAFANEEEYRLHALRHSTAHVMAEAIAKVYPGAKFAFGPPVKDGFYYDVDVDHPITEGDLTRIEEEMRVIVKRNSTFQRRELSKDEAKEVFADQPFKLCSS